jgi:hypothetical protein
MRKHLLSFTVSVAATGFLACGSNRPSEGFEKGEQLTSGLQSNYLGLTESATGKGVHLVKTWRGRKAKSVGAVRPFNDTWSTSYPWESTCGSTFISPHYAITAAHCVDNTMVANTWVSSSNPGTKFVVEEYNITNLDMNEFAYQTKIRDWYTGNTNVGSWPNYYQDDLLTAAEGYVVTSNNCYVYARCAFGKTTTTCDITTGQVDIALIYCPNRTSASDNWVKVAASTESETTGNVEIWWFHEAADLALYNSDPQYDPYMPADSLAHYQTYASESDNSGNWHYTSPSNSDPGKLQLFPLVSYRHANSTTTKYKRVTYSPADVTGLPPMSTLRWTSTRMCHGTSGSGVFVAGSWDDSDPRLLGPVSIDADGADSSGNPGEGLPGLCHKLDNTFNTSYARSGYVRRAYSSLFEAKTIVQNDRPH